MVNETAILGPGGATFPETPWSTILKRAREGRAPDASAWERIAQLYWRPVYFWFRWRWNRSTEDAKDLTQELFSRLVRSDAAGGLDPARGRLRLYIKACADNLAHQEVRDARRIKRGGNLKFVHLDALDESSIPAPVGDQDRDARYDAEWAKSLVRRSLETLRERLRQMEKEQYADVLEYYDLPAGAQPSYEEAAAHFGLTVDQVRNHLRYARGILRSIVREHLRTLVEDPADLDPEYRHLFGTD